MTLPDGLDDETVMLACALALPEATRMVLEPAANAVTRPADDTVATDVFVDDQT